MLARIVENVDVLVGNEEFAERSRRIERWDVKARRSSRNAFHVIEGHEEIPNVKAVATTLRAVHSAIAIRGVRSHGSMARPINRRCANSTWWIRVGGGDGYAAGFFYGLLSGGEQESGEPRLGSRRLLTTFPAIPRWPPSNKSRPFAKGSSRVSSVKHHFQNKNGFVV